jgi:hypothetical protein
VDFQTFAARLSDGKVAPIAVLGATAVERTRF